MPALLGGASPEEQDAAAGVVLRWWAAREASPVKPHGFQAAPLLDALLACCWLHPSPLLVRWKELYAAALLGKMQPSASLFAQAVLQALKRIDDSPACVGALLDAARYSSGAGAASEQPKEEEGAADGGASASVASDVSQEEEDEEAAAEQDEGGEQEEASGGGDAGADSGAAVSSDDADPAFLSTCARIALDALAAPLSSVVPSEAIALLLSCPLDRVSLAKRVVRLICGVSSTHPAVTSALAYLAARQPPLHPDALAEVVGGLIGRASCDRSDETWRALRGVFASALPACVPSQPDPLPSSAADAPIAPPNVNLGTEIARRVQQSFPAAAAGVARLYVSELLLPLLADAAPPAARASAVEALSVAPAAALGSPDDGPGPAVLGRLLSIIEGSAPSATSAASSARRSMLAAFCSAAEPMPYAAAAIGAAVRAMLAEGQRFRAWPLARGIAEMREPAAAVVSSVLAALSGDRLAGHLRVALAAHEGPEALLAEMRRAAAPSGGGSGSDVDADGLHAAVVRAAVEAIEALPAAALPAVEAALASERNPRLRVLALSALAAAVGHAPCPAGVSSPWDAQPGFRARLQVYLDDAAVSVAAAAHALLGEDGQPEGWAASWVAN